jgi:putative transposase
VEQARAVGVELVGQGGLLTRLTKSVLETALEAEMTEHLGYDKHDPMGRKGGNSRNGTRTKTVVTEIGPVDVEVPAIGTTVSHRSSCASGRAAWMALRRSCCR